MAELALKRLQCAKPPFHHDRLAGTLPDGRQFVVEFDKDGFAVVDEEIAKYVVDRARGTIKALPAEEGDEPTFFDPSKSARRVVPNARPRGVISVQDVPELRRLDQSLPDDERMRAAEQKAPEPEFDTPTKAEPVTPTESRPAARRYGK